MNYCFTQRLPDDYYQKAILVSGDDTAILSNYEFLVVEDGESVQCFEIRYEWHCSPFKDAMMVGDVLAVGFEEYFYLYDLTKRQNILRLYMDGYFGNMTFHNGQLLVADACGLHCVSLDGSIVWQNDSLAVDGVLIDSLTDGLIYGQGEHDPPGGWEDFVLDRKTGKKIQG